jgi:2-dehydropantoate 2-reductase
MGAAYASMFARASGLTTALVARGERRQRLQRDGLVVNGRRFDLPVVHPDRATEPADLILVGVKDHHLPAAVTDLQNLVGDGTTLISVMNGLDSEVVLGAAYGSEKVLFAISVGIDAVRDGNRVSYSTPGKLLFGEADNQQLSPRVRRVAEVLDRAGIPHETPEDMIRTLWWKFMVNVGMNQASAVMRAPYGVFRTSRQARALMEALMREVIVLAEPAGVNLEEKDILDWYTVLETLSPEGKTSMLQDIEAGRKTEVEIFGGKVVELGRTYGYPTPVNETLVRIVHVLEEYPA